MQIIGATTDGTIDVDSWTMLTVRRNDTDTSLWINGAFDKDVTNNNPAGDGTDIALGDGTDVEQPNFNGLMDEIGVWNRSLSDSEITDLYNGGSGITYTNVFEPAPEPEPTIQERVEALELKMEELEDRVSALEKFKKRVKKFIRGLSKGLRKHW